MRRRLGRILALSWSVNLDDGWPVEGVYARKRMPGQFGSCSNRPRVGSALSELEHSRIPRRGRPILNLDDAALRAFPQPTLVAVGSRGRRGGRASLQSARSSRTASTANICRLGAGHTTEGTVRVSISSRSHKTSCCKNGAHALRPLRTRLLALTPNRARTDLRSTT